MSIKVNNTIQGLTPVAYANLEPSIDIATISNGPVDKNTEPDTNVILTTCDLSFNDFIASFYHRPGATFSINSDNISFKPLMFTGQTYKTTNDSSFLWDLANQCIKAYCEKHSVSETVISSFKKVSLARETFKTQTIGLVFGTQIGLSWDMVIHSLQNNNQIFYTKDPEDFATVVFNVVYVYHCDTLDVTLEIKFPYRTSIPNYRNIYTDNSVNPNISPYSTNEVNADTIFPNITELLDDKSHNEKNTKKNKKKVKKASSNSNIKNNDLKYNVSESKTKTKPSNYVNLHVDNNINENINEIINHNINDNDNDNDNDNENDNENDNDTVLTKNIVYSNNRIRLNTLFQNDGEDSNDDENRPW
jgi:hypothetical protein